MATRCQTALHKGIDEMEPTSGRLVFNMGKAFPADQPVAVFIVAMSSALNDLITVSKWLVGGDDDEPNRFEVSDVEQHYLLRLTVAQVHELRESLKHARKSEAVAVFLDGLPDTAKKDLDRLVEVATGEASWVRATVKYVRNQTTHYGGKWGWNELEWAMSQLADEDGEIEMRNSKVVGMRLRFADRVANQQLARKWPEYTRDEHADLDEATIAARLETLMVVLREAVVAAQNFVIAALQAYLDSLPALVVRSEDVT